jgi:hypothetical protein
MTIPSALLDPVNLLYTGYIACFVFLNAIAYLIAAFYQRKFDQSTPHRGFVAAIIAALAYAFMLFAGSTAAITAVRILLLYVSAASSAWASLGLFYTMKRIRK